MPQHILSILPGAVMEEAWRFAITLWVLPWTKETFISMAQTVVDVIAIFNFILGALLNGW